MSLYVPYVSSYVQYVSHIHTGSKTEESRCNAQGTTGTFQNLKHYKNTIQIPYKCHSNTVQIPFSKHYKNTIQMPCKCHSNTVQIPFKYRTKIIQMPFKYRTNTIQIPYKYYTKTIQIPYKNHSNAIQNRLKLENARNKENSQRKY